MSCVFFNLIALTLRPFVLGMAISTPVFIVLYFTVPAYTNYINWQFQNPAVLIPAALIGVVLGIATD